MSDFHATHRLTVPLVSGIYVVGLSLALVMSGSASFALVPLTSARSSHDNGTATGRQELNYTGQVGLGPHGNLPYAIALDNRSGQLFVTEQPSYLAVLSDSSSGPLAVATIFLGANTYPEGVVYDGDNNTVFVGTSTNQLLVISPDTLVIEKRILVDFEAETLAFDPVTGDVYAGGGLATFGLNGTDGDYNITVINGT